MAARFMVKEYSWWGQGEEVIVILPWEEWWEYQIADVANCHVAVLPLHPDLRARFNATAAWEYARRMNGLPYGYHNMIFSWIDTPGDNYPPPLDSNLVRVDLLCLSIVGSLARGTM